MENITIVGWINYLEQNEKTKLGYIPKSQPNRKKFGIFYINVSPFQYKIA